MVKTKPGVEHEVLGYLEWRFEQDCSRLEITTKTDLSAMNHLASNGEKFVKLSFKSLNK